MRLFVLGHSNKEIGAQLFITEKAVKWQLTNIYKLFELKGSKLNRKYKVEFFRQFLERNTGAKYDQQIDETFKQPSNESATI